MTHIRTKPKSVYKKSRHNPSHSSDSSNSSPVHGQQDHHSSPSPLNAFYKSGPAFGLNPPVQTKVEVGKANDPYEREADRVSDHVKAGMPAPAISKLPAGGLSHSPQRKENTEEKKEPPVQKKEEEKKEPPVQKKEEEKKEPPVQKKEEEKKEPPIQKKEEEKKEPPIQKKEEEKKEPPVQKKEEEKKEPPVQKKEEEKKEEPVQKEAASGGSSHTSHGAEAASHAINSKGPGSPLSPSTQNALESSMGTDLSHVRVHNDNKANDAARALDARAFTHQNDIWLGKGASPDDVGLMAHEAAHVVQQTGAVQRKIVQRDGTPGAPAAAPAPAASTAVGGTEKKYTGPEGSVDTEKNPVELRLAKLKVPDVKLPFGVKSPLPKKTDDKRPQDQIAKWETEARSGSGVEDKLKTKLTEDKSPKTTKSGQPIYFLKLKGEDNYVIGNQTAIKNRCLRPFWTKSGTRMFYDVDHQRELQLGGDHDAKSNMWLLESEANRDSGRAIKDSRNASVQKLIDAAVKKNVWTTAPSVEEARRNYDIYADKLEGGLPIKGQPGQTWKMDDIRDKGLPVDGLKALSKKEIEKAGLTGSPDQLAIFTSETGGGVRKIPWEEGKKEATVSFPFGKNFYVNKVTYNKGSGGTISGLAFRAEEMQTKVLASSPLTFDFAESDAVDYGGFISQASVTRAAQSALKLHGLSPIQIANAELNPDKGIVAKGKVLPTVPLIKDIGIDLVIDGGNVYLSKTFSTGDFKFPGPIKVTDSSIEIFAGTQGIGVNGVLSFEVERVGKGKLKGTASAGGAGGAGFSVGGEFEFDTKLFDEAKITMDYKNEKFSGSGTLKIGAGKIKGIKSAGIDVKVDGEAWSADGKVTPDIPGIKEGTLSAKYAKEKGFEFAGSLVLADDIPGIKGGSMNATISQKAGGGGYALKGSGTLIPKIPGVNTTIKADYDDGAFSAEGTVAYEKGMLKGSITLGVTNRPVGEGGKPAGEPTKKLTAFGGGTVTIRIAPWLQGTIGIKLLPNGEVEVSGTVGLPSAIDLFPEKKLDKNIFSINLDIPIVGVAVAGQRIGIFATIGGGLDLSAGIGPGQLRDASLGVTYNPAHEEDTKVSGKASFVIPMNAGLRLFVRGALGAGIPIVSATAGLEIGGQLGLAGEARADVSVDWSPAKGLSMEAMGSIMVEPKFKFDITGFVKVEADLLLTTIELYSKRWQLAAFEYGSGLKFGVKFPIKYQEGKSFDISFSDVEFVYPKIDTDALLKDLIKKIA